MRAAFELPFYFSRRRRDIACYVSADSIPDDGERDVASNVSTKRQTYRTTPSSGELAVAYSFFAMRPAR